MQNNYASYTQKSIVKYVRDGLIEQEHYGIIALLGENGDYQEFGQSNDYPFFIRSCAKPLQASLMFDFEIDKELDSQEIALCCASHAGEKVHIKIAENFIKKMGLNEGYLKCGMHKPFSKSAIKDFYQNGEVQNVLQNNCVGKHILMLAICQKNGWSLENYYEFDHPLQKLVKQRIYELCELDSEYPSTKDGCGVPIFAMPLKNLLKGYLNLFLDDKYSKIRDAFLKHPYIIGGEERTDTQIMENGKNLVAKVGAGGLCTVVNLESHQSLVIKSIDCDMKAREVGLFSALRELGWCDISHELDIKTLHNDVVGKIQTPTFFPAH